VSSQYVVTVNYIFLETITPYYQHFASLVTPSNSFWGKNPDETFTEKLKLQKLVYMAHRENLELAMIPPSLPLKEYCVGKPCG